MFKIRYTVYTYVYMCMFGVYVRICKFLQQNHTQMLEITCMCVDRVCMYTVYASIY